MEFSRISNSVTSLGEGISINRNKGRLNWVDISEGKVFCNSLVTGKTEINIDFVLPSCTFQDGKNGVYISHVGGISKIDFEHRTKENCVSWFDIDCGLRCNDGTIDLNGNIWISTMSISHEKNMGKIWFWNLKDKPKLIIDNLTIPNSIAFDSKRKRLYFADSSKNTIYYGKLAEDLDSLTSIQEFHKSENGQPDGSTLDSQGNLWNTRWDGSKILKITPQGEEILQLSMPFSRPTSCTFLESERVMAVTSATKDSDSLGGQTIKVHI